MFLAPSSILTATQRKSESVDLLVFFKENSHTDMYERAIGTRELCIATAERRIKPAKSVFDCEMISIYHTAWRLMRGFVDRMQALESKDSVLPVSIVHSFPWGDCVEYGAEVLVATDDAQEKGETLAETLGHELIAMRDQLLATCLSVDGTLDATQAVGGRSDFIADSADNPGGGAAGDSTFILSRMIERGVTVATLGPLWDPAANEPFPHTCKSLPLDGVTVVDLGQVYRGPYATYLMALAGANVIKIEPLAGEPVRQRRP